VLLRRISHMMRLRWILLLAGVLLLASAVAGIAQPRFGHAAGTTAAKTITVTGNGSVTTVPDRAGFDFTVETRAGTAKAALAQNSDAAAAVVAAVKNAGVADADIQTSQVSLSPQTKQDGTQIIGYIASNSISVKSTIAKAGSIVDAAVGAGADGVSGPSLSISDQDVQYRDALKQAVAAAHAKAQTLADAAGLSLGGAQTVVEGAGQYPVPLAQKADFSAGVTIQPGTQTVDATVTVTYTAT
jgi:uncharacterized protein YggE